MLSCDRFVIILRNSFTHLKLILYVMKNYLIWILKSEKISSLWSQGSHLYVCHCTCFYTNIFNFLFLFYFVSFATWLSFVPVLCDPDLPVSTATTTVQMIDIHHAMDCTWRIGHILSFPRTLNTSQKLNQFSKINYSTPTITTTITTTITITRI